jgi:hypothetical protein
MSPAGNYIASFTPQSAGFFSHQKEKSGIFFAAKIFAGPGGPDFFGKIRNFRKIHNGEKKLQFIVNPVSG